MGCFHSRPPDPPTALSPLPVANALQAPNHDPRPWWFASDFAGVKAFSYRRVKNDQRDAADLADLLRMGRLPHAWIAPPATRELRELVRHRAKLVAMRSQYKAHVHAVLAKGGVWVPMTDLFGAEGNLLLDKVTMPAPYKERIASLRRFIEAFDAEIDLFTGLVQRRLTHDAGYTAIQQIPGIGPVLAAVFVAEIGDVHRFAGPAQLSCWAGLTPSHHEWRPGVDSGHRRGELVDGWHRCHAVIASGQSVEVQIDKTG